jgi:hypothetical protein
VASKTLKKYLCGVKAWHLSHNKEYPYSTKNRVAIMLRTSAREDATLPPKEKKKAVMVKHLVHLSRTLHHRGAQERVVLDLLLMAFWGLAQLGELIHGQRSGKPDPRREPHASDVTIKETPGKIGKASVLLREARQVPNSATKVS